MPIDPQFQQVLDALPMDSIAEVGYERMRQTLRERTALIPVMVPLPRVEDRTTDEGIGLRIYWPVPDPEDLPVVVFYHGGGWAIGDLDSHDHVTRSIAEQVGAVVVAVDYRLAPEHPYPAAVEDAWSALRWVAEHAAELGANPERLAVAGDSAGGNLAAVVSQLARDAGGPAIRFQMLWYPATMIDKSLPSMIENAAGPVINAGDIDIFLEYYIGDRTDRPATLAPAYAADLSGLPPAYVATAKYDPIRDDGARYAELLREAGVAVQHHDADNLAHGYISLGIAAPAAASAFAESLAALKAAL